MISSYLGSPEMADIRKSHKDFDRVFDKIEALIAENAPDGKYVLEEDSVWISISSYETKPEADSKFEAHRDFLDIQLMLVGKERIGFADREDLTVVQPYAPDCELYAMVPLHDDVVLRPGKFTVIYPLEAHAPCMNATDKSESVRKIVAKVRA